MRVAGSADGAGFAGAGYADHVGRAGSLRPNPAGPARPARPVFPPQVSDLRTKPKTRRRWRPGTHHMLKNGPMESLVGDRRTNQGTGHLQPGFRYRAGNRQYLLHKRARLASEHKPKDGGLPLAPFRRGLEADRARLDVRLQPKPWLQMPRTLACPLVDFVRFALASSDRLS